MNTQVTLDDTVVRPVGSVYSCPSGGYRLWIGAGADVMIGRRRLGNTLVLLHMTKVHGWPRILL